MFRYTENTKVLIDGTTHLIKMENGMTGIGSRKYWIDNKRISLNGLVTQSEDITTGNHQLYTINWRENPWDRVDIIISEEELPFLLDSTEQPEWRNPIKINLNK